jgi:hypothetical protein
MDTEIMGNPIMDKDPAMGATRRIQLPLLLVVLGFFIMVAFQTVQLTREHFHIDDVRTAQEPMIQEGTKLRQQLNSMGSKMAQLADAGNANAKAIIEDLKRQGITVKANP